MEFESSGPDAPRTRNHPPPEKVKRFSQREGQVSPEHAERCLKFIHDRKHRAPTYAIGFWRIKGVVERYGERGIRMGSIEDAI